LAYFWLKIGYLSNGLRVNTSSGYDHVLSRKMMSRHLDWMHQTGAGTAHTFVILFLRAGFGVWWLFPPNPALADNASPLGGLSCQHNFQ
jgi:hypothetical protein